MTTSVCVFGSVVLMSIRWANVVTDGLADIALWSVIELGLGLSAGSAAALRPLLRLILDLERVFHKPH